MNTNNNNENQLDCRQPSAFLSDNQKKKCDEITKQYQEKNKENESKNNMLTKRAHSPEPSNFIVKGGSFNPLGRAVNTASALGKGTLRTAKSLGKGTLKTLRSASKGNIRGVGKNLVGTVKSTAKSALKTVNNSGRAALKFKRTKKVKKAKKQTRKRKMNKKGKKSKGKK